MMFRISLLHASVEMDVNKLC